MDKKEEKRIVSWVIFVLFCIVNAKKIRDKIFKLEEEEIKEEKSIRALELKHQELMTSIHTFSWIIFTVLVGYFAVSISNPESVNPISLISVLALIPLWVISQGHWVRCAKNIRDKISKLEEEEKQKEDKSNS